MSIAQQHFPLARTHGTGPAVADEDLHACMAILVVHAHEYIPLLMQHACMLIHPACARSTAIYVQAEPL
jgi:hypothetical protein